MQNSKSAPDSALNEFLESKRSWPDGTAILLLCIPVALGLGILIGHAFLGN
jgi:hypothetical protein